MEHQGSVEKPLGHQRAWSETDESGRPRETSEEGLLDIQQWLRRQLNDESWVEFGHLCASALISDNSACHVDYCLPGICL